MDQEVVKSVGEALVDQRKLMERSRPELVTGYEAFRQSYAAYEKMAAQFEPKSGSVVIAAAGVFKTV